MLHFVRSIGSTFVLGALIATLAFIALTPDGARGAGFPISGSSYTANVVNQRDYTGALTTNITASYVGSADQGTNSQNNLGDDSHESWTIVGIDGVAGNDPGDDSATATLNLAQTYRLNLIKVYVGDFKSDEYEVRVTDGITTTVVAARQSAPSFNGVANISFAARNVNQIQLQVFGPGTDVGGTHYAYPMDVQAFAASDGPAPDIKKGYNILPTATVLSSSNFGSVTSMIDGDPRTYDIPSGPASMLLDFGAVNDLFDVRLNFAYGQSWTGGATIEISPDQLTWYTVVSTTGNLGNNNFVFSPYAARYLRVTGATGSGALAELQVFAIPEPGTMSIMAIAFAGTMFTSRRRPR